MSNVFYAYHEGSGGRSNGCGYTIGCNSFLERLNATSLEAAIIEATGDEWTDYDDERVEKVTVLRVVEEFDCASRIAELRSKREAEKLASEKASKRKYLERLKRELGE